jgi:RNA polymerase sigma-70 factor, ECF subfamily
MNGERVLVAALDATALTGDTSESEAAFGASVQAALAQSYRLAAVILGNLTDAEDATHDAVERAWRSRRQLKDNDRFEAWFQRILVRSCVDQVRKRRSRPLL